VEKSVKIRGGISKLIAINNNIPVKCVFMCVSVCNGGIEETLASK